MGRIWSSLESQKDGMHLLLTTMFTQEGTSLARHHYECYPPIWRHSTQRFLCACGRTFRVLVYR